MNDYLAAAFEWKFAPDAKEGSFEGYGSVFGHQDAHGDIVLPGAFAETLAERKAQGRSIPMHVMHGILGGDGLPVGVQLLAPYFQEGRLLNIAHQYQLNTDWHQRSPEGF